MNVTYAGPADCPEVLPVFPLAGALLLPRGTLPLNIFEPRYLAMIDHALAGQRLIGMIQPQEGEAAVPVLYPIGCAGRITQFAETGDGRMLVSLTGVARFRIAGENATTTPFRQCKVDYAPFAADFEARRGEEAVNRTAVLDALKRFADANDLKVDWKGIRDAPNEALVNALCMMCPYGPRDKQALLEAADLKTRGDLLVAITEFELARRDGGSDLKLQ